MKLYLLRRCFGSAIVLTSMFASAQQFALTDNTTVVLYGDSITAQRLYTRFAEEFVLTRYPLLHIHFVNAGVPGDTTYGGYAGAMAERVNRDVAPFHPAMITVMLGMNDGGYVPESPKMDALFQTGYKALLAALQESSPEAAITLIRPSPYDEITHGTDFPRYSQVIRQNADDVSAMAAQMQTPSDHAVTLVDFYSPLVNALQQSKAQYPQLAALMVPDRIHPGEAAHWIMAAALLSAWHVDPVVSRVAFNAGAAEVTQKDRTTITGLQKTSTGLRWTQTDDDLPLPLDFDNAMTPVLLATSNLASLDQQILRFSNLANGVYELLIDGKPIATFTAAQLRTGVNIALYRTPMVEQARGIDWFEQRRATLDQAAFILSAEVKQGSGSASAEDTLKQAQAELEETVRTKLAPKPHNFELRITTPN
ncbi:MAG TPA: SGNH/GDSL hydrolase family protein [Acidobacteriaceae bacterium]|nr:SGNH/GDSL hydrolase family protein [Acidobacteriaceae bacterium]